MPINKRESLLFTFIMCFCMVFWMSIYNVALRDSIDFNLAYIGSDFNETLPSPFDPGYMRALFDYGYQRGRRGYDWAKQPP